MKLCLRRMIKKQQMRWNRRTVQSFLDVRVAVLNGTPGRAFRRSYPDFRPGNQNIETPPQSESRPFCMGLAQMM